MCRGIDLFDRASAKGENDSLLSSWLVESVARPPSRGRPRRVVPAIIPMKETACAIDFAGVIEVVANHDLDDRACWQSLTPVCEPLLEESRVVGEIAQGGQPPLVPRANPCEKLLSGSATFGRGNGREIAAERGRTEGSLRTSISPSQHAPKYPK